MAQQLFVFFPFLSPKIPRPPSRSLSTYSFLSVIEQHYMIEREYIGKLLYISNLIFAEHFLILAI